LILHNSLKQNVRELKEIPDNADAETPTHLRLKGSEILGLIISIIS
jgi:hypothetical protein